MYKPILNVSEHQIINIYSYNEISLNFIFSKLSGRPIPWGTQYSEYYLLDYFLNCIPGDCSQTIFLKFHSLFFLKCLKTGKLVGNTLYSAKITALSDVMVSCIDFIF